MAFLCSPGFDYYYYGIGFHEIENALRKNVDQNSKVFVAFAQMEITVLKIEAVQKQERIKNKSIKSVVAKKVLVASQR